MRTILMISVAACILLGCRERTTYKKEIRELQKEYRQTTKEAMEVGDKIYSEQAEIQELLDSIKGFESMDAKSSSKADRSSAGQKANKQSGGSASAEE